MAFKEHTALQELDETEIDIEGKTIDDDEIRALWAKQMVIIDSMKKYWQHYLERGKTCFDYLRGIIFDDETRSEYEDVYFKFCVEPRKMSPRINSLVGNLIKSRRSGQVTTEGGSLENPSGSAIEIELVNIVLMHMRDAWKEQRKIRDTLYNAMVSCYPTWMWFEKVPSSESLDAGLVRPVARPWDSTLVAPFYFREVDGSDITAVVHQDLLSTSDLIDAYPEREDIIREFAEKMGKKFRRGADFKDDLDMWDLPISSEEKDTVFFNLMTGISSSVVPGGFHTRYERNFKIVMKETVAVNIFNPQQYEVRPGTWDEDRWQRWIAEKNAEQNTRFIETERPVKLLWTTAITDSGLVLTNGLHWYQENGTMPGRCMIPAMIDSVPSGPAESMLNDLLAIAVARTEFLDDVRKNTGKVIVTRDGSISNPDDLATEFSKPIGFMNVKADAGPLSEVFKEIERKPNTSYLEYAQMQERELDDNTLITRPLMGSSQPDQTGVAKQLEIGQGLIGQSIFVDNFNEFWESYQNLKLSMIPYAYNQYMILQTTDEDFGDQTKIAEVNVPEYDIEGKIISVANDITSAKYRWKMTPVDDSPTAKDDEQKKFVIFMNAVPGPVMQADPSGKLLAKLMMAQSNRLIRDAGKALAKDAELRQQSIDQAEKQKTMAEYQASMEKLKVESEKAGRQGFSLSITGEQLAQFPNLAEALVQLGYIKPQGTGSGQAPAPQQAA